MPATVCCVSQQDARALAQQLAQTRTALKQADVRIAILEERILSLQQVCRGLLKGCGMSVEWSVGVWCEGGGAGALGTLWWRHACVGVYSQVSSVCSIWRRRVCWPTANVCGCCVLR